ncbi:MAG: alpha/beta hydrolase [Pirellulales bacterium]
MFERLCLFVFVAFLVCLQAWLTPLNLAANEIMTTTYTYKTIGDLAIKVDVLRPDDDVKRPVLVNLHGGALIMGNRDHSGRLMDRMLDAGYAVVTIDYRLAPETKLPEIVEDVVDAFRWIRGAGAELAHLDTSKIAVTGGSAGGYLTLVSGYLVQPRPTVLVSVYGYGDLIGDWYAKPSPFYLAQQGKAMTDAQARTLADGPAIADSQDRKGDGGAFYRYCRRRGLWPKYVGGFDPSTEAEKFFPWMPVKNVTEQYPPTMLIHGQQDTDVPHEQSVLMAEQFERHGVPHRFLSIENADHGLRGISSKDKDRIYGEAYNFVLKYMQVE